MSATMDNYPIECGLCNYEANAKSEKAWKMMKRLHKKKCPKTGRTEKGKVAEDVARKMKVFNKTHGHSSFVPSKDNGGTERSIDEEVVQIARTQDLRAGLYERLRRMKAEAENSPEEGERGESSSDCGSDCVECCCAPSPPPCEEGCRCPTCDIQAYSDDCKAVMLEIGCGQRKGRGGWSEINIRNKKKKNKKKR